MLKVVQQIVSGGATRRDNHLYPWFRSLVGYMIGGSGFDLNPRTHWEWLGRAKLSYMEATLNK